MIKFLAFDIKDQKLLNSHNFIICKWSGVYGNILVCQNCRTYAWDHNYIIQAHKNCHMYSFLNDVKYGNREYNSNYKLTCQEIQLKNIIE